MTNQEKIEQLYIAFFKRDRNALNALCSKEIIWKQNPGFPGGGVNVGIEKIIENVFDSNSSKWELFSFKKERFLTFENTVVVEGKYIVKGKNKNEEVAVETAHIFELKNNRVISFQQYTDTKILWDHYKGE